jgi:hypothetical protein
MVQAGARLVERVLAPVPVLGEPQASLQAVVPEKHLAACPVRRGELARAPEAEHVLVPGCARVNVTNRQPEMVTPDHAPAHRVLTRQPVAGGSDAAPGAWNPRARLPLDHLILMPHDTRHAARQIMGDLRESDGCRHAGLSPWRILRVARSTLPVTLTGCCQSRKTLSRVLARIDPYRYAKVTCQSAACEDVRWRGLGP